MQIYDWPTENFVLLKSTHLRHRCHFSTWISLQRFHRRVRPPVFSTLAVVSVSSRCCEIRAQSRRLTGSSRTGASPSSPCQAPCLRFCLKLRNYVYIFVRFAVHIYNKSCCFPQKEIVRYMTCIHAQTYAGAAQD